LLFCTWTVQDGAEGANATSDGLSDERARRQPKMTAGAFAQVKTHMKGGIKNNGKESQGRKEEGWQEALSRTL